MGKIKGALAGSYDRFVKRAVALPDGLLELVRSVDPGSILEFACGTGTVAVGLALEDYEVVGVDYSPDMLRVARRKAKQQEARLRIINGNILEIDLGRQFDLLLCLGNTLPQFTTRAQLTRFLSNCHRHVCPNGGMVVFQQLNYDRIMRDRPRTFAIDLDHDMARFKQYRYRKRLIDFVATIVDGARIPPAVSVTTTELKPWTRGELAKAMKTAGFATLDFFGDYRRTAFSKDTKDLIMVGTVRGLK